MTDLPDEAVEAAYRAYCEARKGKPLAPGEYEATYSSIEVAWLITALTAAAPLIAADLRASRDEWASRMMEFAEAQHALTDLRAGIEALRDEWWMHEAANLRAASTQPGNSSGLLLHTAIAGLCKAHADALDALLRERAR